MKTLTVLATILFTSASFAANYDYGFTNVSAGSLASLQVEIEDATDLINGSTAQFLPGLVLLGNAKCGKVLKSDRDEPQFRKTEMKQKTSRVVTGVKVGTATSYANGSFSKSYTAMINFKCRAD